LRVLVEGSCGSDGTAKVRMKKWRRRCRVLVVRNRKMKMKISLRLLLVVIREQIQGGRSVVGKRSWFDLLGRNFPNECL